VRDLLIADNDRGFVEAQGRVLDAYEEQLLQSHLITLGYPPSI
jgi:hypothetical protein